MHSRITMNVVNANTLDHELVRLSQGGDLKAFGLLVDKYHNRLYRMILRIIKNTSTVEDLVQDSLIRAYRSIGSFRGESAFYTWLYKIGLNTARNYLADIKRNVHIDDSIALEDADNISTTLDLSYPETPESDLMNKQIVIKINDAISELPLELRTSILLREIEGMTYEQISEVMNCPVGTTRSRIFRARNIISEQIKPLLGNETNRRW